MPRQENKKQVIARLEREDVNGETFDVFYVDDKEIVAFHVDNIDSLKLEHTNDTMLELIQKYLKEK